MAGLLIPFQIPIVEVPGSIGSPSLQVYPAHAHCNDGDVVTLGVNTAGQIDPAVANDNSDKLLGVIQADSDAVYGGQGSATAINGEFGASPVNTGLLPAPADGPLVALFATPLSVTAINLATTTGWISGGTHQAAIGTRVGLGKDGTTGIYFADDQAGNKLGTIVAKVSGATTTINNGQTNQPVGPGGVGDLAARVYVEWDAAVLAAAGGL